LTDYADDDDIEGGPEDEGFEGGEIPFYGKQSKEIFDKTFDKLVNDEKTSLRLMLVVFPVHLHAPFDIRFNVMCHNFLFPALSKLILASNSSLFPTELGSFSTAVYHAIPFQLVAQSRGWRHVLGGH